MSLIGMKMTNTKNAKPMTVLEPDLMISTVINRWDFDELRDCLKSLSASIEFAQEQSLISTSTLYISYNGGIKLCKTKVEQSIRAHYAHPFKILNSPNKGYGGTNNRILKTLRCSDDKKYVLVMNTDLFIRKTAISEALKQLNSVTNAGFVAPLILDSHGETPSYGNKRYPSITVLVARYFPILKHIPFLGRLNQRYEYQNEELDKTPSVEICSGCFLISTIRLWQETKGFDERFFMYFEDFDLCLRATKLGFQHTYNGKVIVHHKGGSAAQKKLTHTLWFTASLIKFFHKHGWRIYKVGSPN